MSTDIVVWIGAFITLGAYSYLFKENWVYRAVEHIYVGAAAGYTITMGYKNLITKAWDPLTENGQYWVLIPVILGLMLFGPYFGSKYAFLRRYPLSFVVGIGAGITVRSSIVEQFVRQIASTIIPLNSIANVVIVLGVIATLSYFFFTLKPTPALRTASELGKWVIMITFGAAFGNAIMGRLSLLISSSQDIFGDWLGIIKF